MKTLRVIVSALLVIITMNGFAQKTYNITRVQGTITNLTQGVKVEAGQAVSSQDHLLFESHNSYAIAIDDATNRYQLKLRQMGSEGIKPNFTAVADEVAQPTQMRNLMLSRFNPSETDVSDLRQYFGNDRFTIIGNEVNVPLNQESYRLSDDQFIVFYYKVENSTISKKVGFDDQTLLLEKEKLLSSSAGSIEGNEIANLTVYEYQMSSKSSREITRFTLVFVDKDELISEFNTIIPILKRQKMADIAIKKYLIEYYYDFYGATDSKTIDAFAEQIVKNF